MELFGSLSPGKFSFKNKNKSADGHMKKTQDRAIKAMCPVDVI